jgi:uncharacterized membrane protein YebE (DUF533 family)
MIDINRILNTMLAGNGSEQGGRPNQPQGGFGGGALGGLGDLLGKNAGALGAGALAGTLAGTLLGSKGARKLAGSALKLGAAAVIGGLAYSAYQNYRAGKPVLPGNVRDALGGMLPGAAGTATAAALPPPATGADTTILLRAMIAASMADGRLDERERRKLLDHVGVDGFTEEEQAFLDRYLAEPDTTDSLAAVAQSPQQASEIYLAALFAIEADTILEKTWLDDLAAKLNLPSELRRNIEDALRQAPATA